MKTFACRICFALPVVAFGIYVLMAVFGVVSNVFGAQDGFYCSVYCKLGLGLLIISLLVVLFVQARACMKGSKRQPPQIPA